MKKQHVSLTGADKDYLQKLLKKGLENIDAVVAENVSPFYDLNKYFTQNISYELNEEKLKGLEKFLSFLKK